MSMVETKHEQYDLIIVGGGPSGLSAAINAESEGINTLLVDAANELGGQAGTSSRIENYPGFPGGITGRQLTSNMIDQALGFETEFLAPWRAESINPQGEIFEIKDDREALYGRSLLIACGVQYRRLVVPNLAAYLGRGVTYGSPDMDDNHAEKKVYVVGGANSAGQAAVHLSGFTDCKVSLLLRGDNLKDKMSEYLVDRIEESENINVHTQTEIIGVEGDSHLKELVVRMDGEIVRLKADEVFLMIGAEPKTMWLPEQVAKDEKGYIHTGSDISEDIRGDFAQQCGRQPYAHESSVPGLFVAGDIRSGTTKRVASAVGDGAVVVPELHRYLNRV